MRRTSWIQVVKALGYILSLGFVAVSWMPQALAASVYLDVAAGTKVTLAPGKHVYDYVNIAGVVNLTGDTEIYITGKNIADATVFTMAGYSSSIYSGPFLNATPPDAARGVDGVNGAPGTPASDVPPYTPGGGAGQAGTDATDGADGIPGWKLTIVAMGNVYLNHAVINVNGQNGGYGGKGGDGGKGGGCGATCAAGSGGDGGNGGNGGKGGAGGSFSLTVMGNLTIRESHISASGGAGGAGNKEGAGGEFGAFTTLLPGASLPHYGIGGLAGHGGDAGDGGSIDIWVENDCTLSNYRYPTSESAVVSYLMANGGTGGAGSFDGRGSPFCTPGLPGDAGQIQVLVKGHYQESLYPLLARGGDGGNVYGYAWDMQGKKGGRGGTVICEAMMGIVSETGILHFGAQGGSGSRVVTGHPWNPDNPAIPGPGGDGGFIQLRGPVITDHTQPLYPGPAAGPGGADISYDPWIYADPGIVGATETILTPPSFAPELHVYDGAAEVVSPTGVVDLGWAFQGASPLLKAVTVKNIGTWPLSTEDLHLPGGFSLAEDLDRVIPAGGASDSSTLRFDSDSPIGVYTGKASFTHTDGRVNPFQFDVKAEIVDVPSVWEISEQWQDGGDTTRELLEWLKAIRKKRMNASPFKDSLLVPRLEE